MAGQAKRDPSTQPVARLRDGETPSESNLSAAPDARPQGGRLKAGHDEQG